MKNKVPAYLMLIIGFILVSFFIYWIIITPSPIGIIKADDSGSWMAYLGAIVGGLLTLEGVRRTIKKHDEWRVEDRRTSVAPFMTYTVDCEMQSDKVLPTGLWFSNKQSINNDIAQSDSKLDTQILVKNIGLRAAINPYILEVVYDGIINSLGYDTHMSLDVNEFACIPLCFELPDDLNQLKDAKLKLGYYNVLQDFYEQTIIIKFTIQPIYKPSKSHIEYKCEGITIGSIELATLSSPEKYQGLNFKINIPSYTDK